MTAGDPKSQRWIETRLMTKQQGEWIGYSYEWLDDQTDAVLVEAGGHDKAFAIRDRAGDRRQTWHYPSRTECMACHTRAAGFVLGLTTEQMNKIQDYGNGVKLNQIKALERLGVLKTDWLSKAKDSLRNELKSDGKTQAEIEERLNSSKPLDGQLQERSHQLLGAAPETLAKVSDPYDATEDLSIYAPLDRMQIVDVTPTHHTFYKPDAKLIAPGDPDRAVLLHRVGLRGPGQMPQLSTSVVDAAAVTLLREWVRHMSQSK